MLLWTSQHSHENFLEKGFGAAMKLNCRFCCAGHVWSSIAGGKLQERKVSPGWPCIMCLYSSHHFLFTSHGVDVLCDGIWMFFLFFFCLENIGAVKAHMSWTWCKLGCHVLIQPALRLVSGVCNCSLASQLRLLRNFHPLGSLRTAPCVRSA